MAQSMYLTDEDYKITPEMVRDIVALTAATPEADRMIFLGIAGELIARAGEPDAAPLTVPSCYAPLLYSWAEMSVAKGYDLDRFSETEWGIY